VLTLRRCRAQKKNKSLFQFPLFSSDEMAEMFVLVRVGCLECGDYSFVLGVFTSEVAAHNAMVSVNKYDNDYGSGGSERYFVQRFRTDTDVNRTLKMNEMTIMGTAKASSGTKLPACNFQPWSTPAS
jgi:hypothetical protein